MVTKNYNKIFQSKEQKSISQYSYRLRGMFLGTGSSKEVGLSIPFVYCFVSPNLNIRKKGETAVVIFDFKIKHDNDHGLHDGNEE